jgi:small-conductance mechanosensitive channel
MDLKQYFDLVVFSLFDYQVTWGMISLSVLTLIAGAVTYWLVARKLFPILKAREDAASGHFTRFRRQFYFTLILSILLGLWYSIGFEYNLESLTEGLGEAPPTAEEEGEGYITLTVGSLFASFLTWQLSRLFIFLFAALHFEKYLARKQNIMGRKSRLRRLQDHEEKRAIRNFRYLVRTLAVLFIISILDIDFQLAQFTLNKTEYTFRVSNLISALLVFLLARLIIWLTIRFFLAGIYDRREVDPGSQYAINQLFQYVIYFVALLLILNVMGVNPTVLAGSAAALLLGVGLGLQQTFNDFFSGILLLFERSVEVGDMVEVDGLVGTVRHIGMRASHIQTRDNLTVIVPNSRLITNSLVNWSHADLVARFLVRVGVAYGSDTALVKKILLEVAKENEKILPSPEPFVRFVDFGDSSLDFELHFWTAEFIRVEDLKSDLRFSIDGKFREHQVEIPFPQRDIWIKSSDKPQG